MMHSINGNAPYEGVRGCYILHDVHA
jgi:hypothetical protein